MSAQRPDSSRDSENEMGLKRLVEAGTPDKLVVQRGTLIASAIFGVGALCYFALFSTATGGDFGVYYQGVLAVNGGGPVYPVDGGRFVYPPVMLLVFSPLALLPQVVAFALFSAVSIGIVVVLTRWTARTIDRTDRTVSRTDVLVIGVAFVASTQSVTTLSLGQVNFWTVALLAAGFRYLERGRELRAGVALAVAAVPKIFLGFMGLYLLRQRAWRAAAAAVLTGFGSFVLGAIVYGVAVTARYVEFLRQGGIATGFLDSPGPPSANAHVVSFARPFKVLFPGLSTASYLAAALCLTAVVLAVLYADQTTYRQRLAAYLGTIVLAILLVPPEHAYGILVFYPALPLLYLVETAGEQWSVGLGLLLVNLPVVPEQLERVASGLPAQSVSTALLDGVLRPVLEVVSFPFVGLTLLLSGCVLCVVRSEGEQSGIQSLLSFIAEWRR